MSSAGNTIERLAALVGDALAPLAEALGSPRDVLETLEELGFIAPAAPPSLVALGTAVQAVIDALADVEEKRRALEDETGTEEQLLAALAVLLVRISVFAAELRQLKAALEAELPPAFVAATGLPDVIERRLFDNAAVIELQRTLPALVRFTNLLGLTEEIEVEADPARFQPDFVKRSLRLDRITMLLGDPEELLRDVYGWGTPDLDAERLFDALERVSHGFVVPVEIHYASDALRALVAPGAHEASEDEPEPMLVVPLLETEEVTFRLAVLPVPKADPAEAQGLAFLLTSSFGSDVTVPLTPTLSLTIGGALDLAAGLVAVVRPDRPPTLAGDPGGSPVVLTGGRAEVRLDYGSADAVPLLVVPGGSRIEAAEVFALGGAEVRSGTPDVFVGGGVTDGRFVLSLSEADGFLASVLPEEGVTFAFDFGVRWSQREGLRFEGSGGLDTTLALNVGLGPFRLQALHLALRVAEEALALETSLTGGVDIGPVTASVERIGMIGDLAFRSGNLGPVDLALRFKPPSGLGIAIDAGPVSGGGFIRYDEPNGRYAGVLQLEVFGVSVSAIGLLDTKLPDGREGFSFLIVISVEFTPIQLGFGFTLNGVGGLAGIHRSIQLEALRAGVYAGSLDHVLFPRDPIANAPQLISDLSRIFPPTQGQHTFGPMAKLGWGTPTLVHITLGIVIELPSPLRIALLGQIAAFLPTREADIVEIHVDFVAVIDFGAKLFSLDAVLRDSRIVVWTLTGDMAARVFWGRPANLAIALGGFHPAFQPPPGFPVLRRLALALGAGDDIRITCQSYQAVTSNSLQFGARAELYVDMGVFVRGWIGFDALIIYSPFSFQVDFTAGLEVGVGSIKVAGLTVDGTLSGPTPWRVRGEATISLFFFDISVDFDEKFGEERRVELPPADPWPPLRQALLEPRNWSATLPPGALAVASLAAAEGTTAVLVDPCGRATWHEHVAPLDRTLTRFGNASTPAPVKFTVDRVTVGTTSSSFTAVTDSFAAGQFEDLTDDEKLSRPSFEPMNAGVEVASGTARLGPSVPAEIVYETRIIDSELESRRGPRVTFDYAAHLALLASSAAARSPLLASGLRAFAAERKLARDEETFVVVSTVDLGARADISAPTTKGAAWQALEAYVASRPAERGTLQVVPVHELEDA
jgi:hypothetical protein